MTSLDILSKYLLIMELHFDAMLCSNVGNENTDVGHMKCSHRPRFPAPALNCQPNNALKCTQVLLLQPLH